MRLRPHLCVATEMGLSDYPAEANPMFPARGRTHDATTPKWSDSFLPSRRLLSADTDVAARSALSAMWSILARPSKAMSDVTIRMSWRKG